MSKELIIGKSVPIVDGAMIATGRAKYSADIKLPGMLFGKMLRSPHSHARIKRIGTTKAEKLPGVKAVLTFKNSPKTPYNPSGLWDAKPTDKRILDEKVRHFGEAVAAVVAVDEDIAEEALELIEVEYEELPVVLDPNEAMKLDAPRIHEVDRNIAAHIINKWGDVEKGFKDTDYIFEDVYKTQIQQHCPLESHTCIASYELGKLTVWSSTQVPFTIRRALAGILNMPLHKVRVIAPFIGGGFGGKSEIILEPICAFLAIKTGGPVKMELTRDEEFCATTTRHSSIIELKTGIMKDGTIKAREIKVILNSGAYASHGPLVAGAMATREIGLYRAPNVKFEAYCVYTNLPTAGGCRGYGNPQGAFAVESQLDDIAEKLGIDPKELRLKNIIQTGDRDPGSGFKIESCGLEECIQKATERIDWEKKRTKQKEDGRKKGVGMACVMHNSGARPYMLENSTAIVKINEDGTIILLTGVCDIGTGSRTTLSQIAAEELGIKVKDVMVASTDTEVVPPDRGTYASGSIYIGGEAVRRAVADAKHQLLQIAAKKLKTTTENLEIADANVFVKGKTEVKIPIKELENKELIIGKASYVPPSNAPSFGAQCVEVEVDMETGDVGVIKVAYAHDVGRAINPTIVEGQIEGGVGMGIGYALIEALLADNKTGRILNPTFIDYKIPKARDMPKIEPIIVESMDPSGPFGAKGVGEPATVPTAAAISNAIYNATGIRIKEIPITPEKLLKLLKVSRHVNYA